VSFSTLVKSVVFTLKSVVFTLISVVFTLISVVFTLKQTLLSVETTLAKALFLCRNECRNVTPVFTVYYQKYHQGKVKPNHSFLS
jgi:hypothetical protein